MSEDAGLNDHSWSVVLSVKRSMGKVDSSARNLVARVLFPPGPQTLGVAVRDRMARDGPMV